MLPNLPPQGSIVLKLEKETDDTVLFTVTDTGCGIPKDKQANIFQRFEKLNENAQGSVGALHMPTYHRAYRRTNMD